LPPSFPNKKLHPINACPEMSRCYKKVDFTRSRIWRS
jgi:hypothetical protein